MIKGIRCAFIKLRPLLPKQPKQILSLLVSCEFQDFLAAFCLWWGVRELDEAILKLKIEEFTHYNCFLRLRQYIFTYLILRFSSVYSKSIIQI